MGVLLDVRRGPLPDLTGRRVLLVGHRGASADLPENTLSAVRRARSDGADLVEVDVRRTRDGALVLLHDETLTRTTDVRRVLTGREPWRVADLDLADVRRVDAGARRGRTREPVPTLVEALPLAPLLLDLKQVDVEDLARLLPTGSPDLLVQSGEVAAVRHLKALRPDVAVAVLGRPAVEHLPMLATWACGVHLQHLRLDRDYVRRLHDHGLRCLTWTVNGPRFVERAVRLGVDGIITDRPHAVREQVAQLVG